MKKNYIVKLLFVAFIAVTGFASCKSKTDNKNAEQQHDETADTSLAYLLQPVNEQVIAAIPIINPRQGTQIYAAEAQGRITYDTRNQKSIASRVNGRIERLFIKYNYQPVKKGQLIMEIYSPELAVAQRELLFIKQTGNAEGMLLGAKQRLLLLGMRLEEIDRILRTGKISYRVPVYSNADGFILEQSTAARATASIKTSSSGGGTAAPAASLSPVLIREGEYVTAGQSVFTIYQTGSLIAEFALNPEIAAHVKKNANIVVQSTSNKEETYNGNIGLIQPTFSEGENFTVARVYLKNTRLTLGELVTANISVMVDKGWWVPKEAVVSLGNKVVVFKKEARVFVPKQVTAGLTVKGQVQILNDISSWNIASNAYYLVDSESFIKIQQNKEL